MLIAEALCYLYLQTATHARMDNQSNILVRRCHYNCDGVSKTHQIYFEDKCPDKINKRTRSIYKNVL